VDREAEARETRIVAAVGVLTAVLFGVTYLSQRALFPNGWHVRANDVSFQANEPHGPLLVAQLLTAATLGFFGLYVFIVLRSRRQEFRASRAKFLALALPAALGLCIVFTRPYFSIDVFSYIAHGELASSLDQNPYVDPPSDVLAHPLGKQLVEEYGWRPIDDISPYGPLWTNVEALVAQLTDEASTAVFALKAVSLTGTLACALIIWLILGRVFPSHQLTGTLIFLWNPLVLFELVGEGHNDSLMILFTLLALGLVIGARIVGAVVALVLAILTKYLPFIMLPAFAMYTWRRHRRGGSPLLLPFAVAVVAAVVLTIVFFAPFWAGSQTFSGVRQSGTPGYRAAAPTAIFVPLSHVLGESSAETITALVVTVLFAVYLLFRIARVRDEVSLIAACAAISLAYVLFASPRYWPWYVTIAVAFMALLPDIRVYALVVALSVCARLVAPLDVVEPNGFISDQTQIRITAFVGIVVPIVVWFGILFRGGRGNFLQRVRPRLRGAA
jgi:Gpi18-like mannosyltransferase